MQIHQIKPKNPRKRKKRIGRGGKRGVFSGKGTKGQKSRAGRRMQPLIRTLIKKYPKLRGYSFKAKNKNQNSKIAALNIETLEKQFQDGDKVSFKSLLEKRIIRKIKGAAPRVKILGRGNLNKKITIEKCMVSKTAREKIKKTGGKIL